MTKPFFSVLIPTFNRPADLKRAIKSVLLQNFQNYEIVVSDNSDSDETKKMCREFQDLRIRYYHNKTNIGSIRNIYQVIKLARGNYIFILGDDDLLFTQNILSNLFKIIEKGHFGYIRLKYIHHRDFKYLCLFTNLDKSKVIKLPDKQSNIEVYQFIFNTSPQFISGLVFKNIKDIHIPEIEKPKSQFVHMEMFWIRFLFEAAKRYGAYLDLDDIIIAHTPNYVEINFYDVVDNKIVWEHYWKLIFKDLKKKDQKWWIKKDTTTMINIFPSIKYYSSNKNLWLQIRRMLQLNSELFYNPNFYFWAIIAFFMPKRLWRLLEKIVLRFRIIHDKDLNKKFNLLKSLISY